MIAIPSIAARACSVNACASCPAAAPLASAVRHDRLVLGLTIERAAELAGLTAEQWEQIEYGLWVPEDGPELRAVADALEANYDAVSFAALLSRERQQRTAVYC